MSYDNDHHAMPITPIEVGKGYVALILAESILHMLVEKNLLKTEDAVGALQTTIEVKLALAERDEEPPEATRAAIDALFQMMDSFAIDLDPEARSHVRTYWDPN